MQNVRQFGKCILEQVSDTRGLSCGLRFLCSCKASLSATFLGLRHAMELVILLFSKFFFNVIWVVTTLLSAVFLFPSGKQNSSSSSNIV